MTHTEYMRDYINTLAPGDTFIVDTPEPIRETVYQVESVISGFGKTSVTYTIPGNPQAGTWALTRPGLTMVTIVERSDW